MDSHTKCARFKTRLVRRFLLSFRSKYRFSAWRVATSPITVTIYDVSIVVVYDVTLLLSMTYHFQSRLGKTDCTDIWVPVYNTCTLLKNNVKYVDANLDAPDNAISDNESSSEMLTSQSQIKLKNQVSPSIGFRVPH